MRYQIGIDLFQIEWLTPRELYRIEFQIQARRVIDQPVAELTIAENKSRFAQKRNLSADSVIGEAAGAEENFNGLGDGELT